MNIKHTWNLLRIFFANVFIFESGIEFLLNLKLIR